MFKTHFMPLIMGISFVLYLVGAVISFMQGDAVMTGVCIAGMIVMMEILRRDWIKCKQKTGRQTLLG